MTIPILGLAATILSDLHLHEHPVPLLDTFTGGWWILHKCMLDVLQFCTEGPYWLQITKACSPDELRTENNSVADGLILFSSSCSHCYYKHLQSIPGILCLYLIHLTYSYLQEGEVLVTTFGVCHMFGMAFAVANPVLYAFHIQKILLKPK